MRLYGKNPILERLKSNPRTIRKIMIQYGHQEAGYILKKAKQWGIPVFQVPQTKIQKVARSVNTQGLVADVEGFAYQAFDDLLDWTLKKKGSLVFLDELNDPQNLGGMIRSLACLGGFGLVLPTHNSVEVTETVLRIASGGDNFVQIAKVNNLSHAIRGAQERGFWVAGTVVKDGEDIREAKLSFPLALVIGSEQKGIRPAVLKHLDQRLTLPMAHERLSMNAAHAATLFCYEISRQAYHRKRITGGQNNAG